MDISQYRSSGPEQQRTADLLRLMPEHGRHALDIGARDGHFSRLMAERFDRVTALDLSRPDIVHPRIDCVQGDATALQFADGCFDFVFCAEVLEHIPSPGLEQACREIERVASRQILIGVPYRQDLRVGRTTCYHCGRPNPPWGHVNRFDEARLATLFPGCRVETRSFVGSNRESTNWLSTALMDYAGNPWGSYTQEEPCIHCGSALKPLPPRTPAQKLATRLAFWTRQLTERFTPAHGNWLHLALIRHGVLQSLDPQRETATPAGAPSRQAGAALIVAPDQTEVAPLT